MTEDEMEKLAELIFQKLLTRQAEFDDQFIEQLKSSGQEFKVEFDKSYPIPPISLTEEEKLIEDHARLSKLLSQYEEKEQYEQAAIIKNKLKKIENKLNKL